MNLKLGRTFFSVYILADRANNQWPDNDHANSGHQCCLIVARPICAWLATSSPDLGPRFDCAHPLSGAATTRVRLLARASRSPIGRCQR